MIRMSFGPILIVHVSASGEWVSSVDKLWHGNVNDFDVKIWSWIDDHACFAREYPARVIRICPFGAGLSKYAVMNAT